MSRPEPTDGTTRALLLCGVFAGPFFTLSWLIQGAIRPDYSPLRHPISSLAIGESGWVQTATFIVTGLLVVALAFGLRRVLLARNAPARLAPILITAIGLGLIGAGLFVTDPMNGYPPGTPLLPADYSVAGRLHRSLSALVFLALPTLCFVFARLLARWKEAGWSAYSWGTGGAFIAAFVASTLGFLQIGGLESYAGLLQRTTLTIGWTWMMLLALHLLPSQNGPSIESNPLESLFPNP